MADFYSILPNVLKKEGGYAFHPNDPGGETYRGITKVSNPNWSGWPIIANYQLVNGPLKTNQLIDDPKLNALVQSFYHHKWNNIKGNDIASQKVAHTIFDAYINQTGWLRQMMEETLAKVGQPINIGNPFKMSSAIVAKINASNPDKFYKFFNKEREERYRITASRPGQNVFLEGWLKRLSEFNTRKNKALVGLLALSLIVGTFYYYQTRNQ